MIYYPLLKNANNEMKALKFLSSEKLSAVTPIIEGKEIREQDLPKLETRLGTLGNYLKERVPTKRFIYDLGIQLKTLPDGTFPQFSNGINYVTQSLKLLQDNDLTVIPCIHVDSPDFLLNTLIEFPDLSSIAIRIRLHAFQYSMDSLIISKVISDLEKFSEDTEKFIILDYYTELPADHSRTNAYIKQLSNITHTTFIFLSTNCPENAQNAETNAITTVAPRLELTSYQSLVASNDSSIPIAFGDYTTRLEGVVLSGFDMNKSYLKIFYSTETDYVILKSKLIKDNGEEDFYQVCQEFIETPAYSGNGFSYGDNQIFLCAKRKFIIVPHQEPIAISVNHHIELTVNIIHSLYSSTPF